MAKPTKKKRARKGTKTTARARSVEELPAPAPTPAAEKVVALLIEMTADEQDGEVRRIAIMNLGTAGRKAGPAIDRLIESYLNDPDHAPAMDRPWSRAS